MSREEFYSKLKSSAIYFGSNSGSSPKIVKRRHFDNYFKSKHRQASNKKKKQPTSSLILEVTSIQIEDSAKDNLKAQ